MSSAVNNTHALTEIQEKEESHTTRQMALNSELLEIQKRLILKESLAVQLASNTQYMVDYKVMAENEAKISILEKEKDELLHQLKNMQTQGPSCKFTDQRRKRMQELETQLHDLKKKVIFMIIISKFLYASLIGPRTIPPHKIKRKG